MTPDERRQILADMVVDEVKRTVRATSRRLGAVVFETEAAAREALLTDARPAAEKCLRQSGGGDMMPVTISMRQDPKHPYNRKKVVLIFEGPLFTEAHSSHPE